MTKKDIIVWLIIVGAFLISIIICYLYEKLLKKLNIIQDEDKEDEDESNK